MFPALLICHTLCTVQELHQERVRMFRKRLLSTWAFWQVISHLASSTLTRTLELVHNQKMVFNGGKRKNHYSSFRKSYKLISASLSIEDSVFLQLLWLCAICTECVCVRVCVSMHNSAARVSACVRRCACVDTRPYETGLSVDIQFSE